MACGFGFADFFSASEPSFGCAVFAGQILALELQLHLIAQAEALLPAVNLVPCLLRERLVSAEIENQNRWGHI